jgi:hypothetical protein
MAARKGAVLLRRRVGNAMARSDFAAEFQRSLDIYQAIEAVVSRAASGSGLIDATEVVRHLMAEHPGITMTEAELAEAVVQAAAHAGVRLSYRVPMP